MAYASWSVVFGEQPSAAKWNILGTNDASFNDGTGISNIEIGSGHTSMKLDYKFSAYRNAAFNFTSSLALLTFDTKNFDTGTNYDTSTGKFTAPVTGFYFFNWQVLSTTTGNGYTAALYKNGVEIARGSDVFINGTPFLTVGTGGGTKLVSASATDYFQIYIQSDATRAGSVTNSGWNYFEGFLLSQT